MANKMTYVMALDMALNALPEDFNEDAREKLVACKASYEKKNSTERKPSAKQVENDAIRGKILDFLNTDPDKGFRISEICGGVPELEGASSQRVSGLLRTLFLNGQIDKYVDKRVTYFKVMDI